MTSFAILWSASTVGFSADKNFREKIQKYFFVFRNRFREISFFLRKLSERKNEKTMINFAKKLFDKIISRTKKSAKALSVVAATINCEEKLVKFSALRAQH